MGQRFIIKEGEIYVYNDLSLDPYIEILDIIENNEDWIFLEALTNFHDSFVFYDCNELSYKLYLYAKRKAIPYEVRGEKWKKIYGIEECQQDTSVLQSPILISDETRTIKNNAENQYSNACYAFLYTIYNVNILLKTEKLKNKEILFQRLTQRKTTPQTLYLQMSYANYLALIKIINSEEIPYLLREIKKATSKEIMGILCNCQGDIIFQMLKKQEHLLKKYFVVLLPPLWVIKNEEIKNICPDIFSELDVFIYQFVKKTFYQPFFATDNIVGFLKVNCKRICLPDLYFSGYYPQCSKEPVCTLLKDSFGNTIFQVRDYYIENIYSQTKSVRKTIEILLRDDKNGFDKEEIEQNWEAQICKMVEKELITDIKMADDILSMIKRKRLFTAAHNPVNELIYIEVKKLLSLLSVPFVEFDYDSNRNNFGGAEQIVYPYVKNVLNLEFEVPELYINTKFTDKKFRVEEYIELYIRNICDIEL